MCGGRSRGGAAQQRQQRGPRARACRGPGCRRRPPPASAAPTAGRSALRGPSSAPTTGCDRPALGASNETRYALRCSLWRAGRGDTSAVKQPPSVPAHGQITIRQCIRSPGLDVPGLPGWFAVADQTATTQSQACRASSRCLRQRGMRQSPIPGCPLALMCQHRRHPVKYAPLLCAKYICLCPLLTAVLITSGLGPQHHVTQPSNKCDVLRPVPNQHGARLQSAPDTPRIHLGTPTR